MTEDEAFAACEMRYPDIDLSVFPTPTPFRVRIDGVQLYNMDLEAEVPPGFKVIGRDPDMNARGTVFLVREEPEP